MREIFRVHPAIGVARVGNSQEYNLAPETITGLPDPDGGSLVGGLPLRAGSEAEAITSADVRDGSGALRRQAVRFRIFGYPETMPQGWPTGEGTEITIGSDVGGRIVADIIWTVHVANKKANTFVLVEDEDQPQGIAGYRDGRLPPIRNAAYPVSDGARAGDLVAVLNDPARVRALTIDPGPRTVSGASASAVSFDRVTPASWVGADHQVTALPNYPKTFPGDTFTGLQAPGGAIDTLGEVRTDERGRLIFTGGYGRAAGWPADGVAAPLADDVNNDQWFDDTADGPVGATLVFDDGTVAEVHGGWVTATDPGFAPQILNTVSLWDDMYDVWVRQLGLAPQIYRDGEFQYDYQPTFEDQIRPIFASASLQRWTTNLNPHAQAAHQQLATITAETDPGSTSLSGLSAIFRDPAKDQYHDLKLMPLALGDANQSMLALRETQYFFLQRWTAGAGSYLPGWGRPLGPGEHLDKAALANCLGGRFSPGIDLTFVVRDPAIYLPDWATSAAGPFRIHRKDIDYATPAAAGGTVPVLTAGYVPLHVYEAGLEPGDLSKFMANPWHTDYNSCATHTPSPNPDGNRTLFWSWPAQRPVAVYRAEDVSADLADPVMVQGPQLWSVRGPGTDSPAPENWGRFQPPIAQMLDNWHRIGVVLQAPAIEDAPHDADDTWFLEVQGQLRDTGRTPVEPFPNRSQAPFDDRELFHKLMNVNTNPDVVAEARAFTEHCLQWAERFSDDPSSPEDQQFFPYSPAAVQQRLDFIYQELVDQAATSDPCNDPDFTTRDSMITRIMQLAPFNLTDGAWLRNIGRTGPIDEVRSLLYSISMDELGDGDVSKNHCNIYLDLCHSVGYYPPPLNSREFAFDPQLLTSAFTVPAFELAISQFSEDYYPELLGMTVQLEWEVVDLKPTRDLMEYFGIDPHFYVMHIGIDNAVNGHGQRAVEAIHVYLDQIQQSGGEQAAQAAWRRIWNGFVAFGNLGNLGTDLQALLRHRPTLEEQVLAMITDKAKYGSLNHQHHTVGDTRIDDWFRNPEGFLQALIEHGLITPGDWAGSRLRAMTDFETGPMFRVFTDDEIALWAEYTRSLTEPTPPPPPPMAPPARAMEALVDELRPVQAGTPGHQANLLADLDGRVHPLAWWFTQPSRALLQALSAPRNRLVVAGDPGASVFVTDWIAPTAPMGPVFDAASTSSPGHTRRDVVLRWITAGCPLTLHRHTTLRLNSARDAHERHPSGRLHGMATVH